MHTLGDTSFILNSGKEYKLSFSLKHLCSLIPPTGLPKIDEP